MPRTLGFSNALVFILCGVLATSWVTRGVSQDGPLPVLPQLADTQNGDPSGTPSPEGGDRSSPAGISAGVSGSQGLLAPDRTSLQDFRDDAETMANLILELPEEVQADAKVAWDEFGKTGDELAVAMGELRQIQIHYRNDYDRTPASIVAFRETRNKVWDLMQAEFRAALELIRYLPSSEAGSYLCTMVQHHFLTDIYNAETFEASARLLDLRQNYKFLYLSGARSAVVSGKFESARKIYEALKDEDLDDADRKLIYFMDEVEKQYNEEQAAIEATASDTLPQVEVETTIGRFTIELFPDAAPSTVSHFLKLVRNGFYDGVDWSVVTDHVLALTGDVSNDGRGNSGEFLMDEHESEGRRNALRGSLIMAKIPMGQGDFLPNSASSQFAIAFLPVVSVAETQTVFGRVIEGMDVVSRLRRVDPTKEKKKTDVSMPPDSIISMEIIRDAKDLPAPQYVDVQKQIREAVEAGLLKPKTASP